MIKIDRAIYFETLRTNPFAGSLSQDQVNGISVLLDIWEENYAPLGWDYLELDYNMGTTFHETGTKMQPVMERGNPTYFAKYDIMGNPKKAKELGNTEAGDGYVFRGAGHVQNTGRANAGKASKRLTEFLGRKIDFVNNPDLRLDPELSAHSLFLGNHEGWWTGNRLPEMLEAGEQNWKNDRSVVNGTDKWREIGNYAAAFGLARAAATRQPNPTLDASQNIQENTVVTSEEIDQLFELARRIKSGELPIVINVNFTFPSPLPTPLPNSRAVLPRQT